MDRLLSLENYYLVRRVPLGISVGLISAALFVVHSPNPINMQEVLRFHNLYLVIFVIGLVYFTGFILDVVGLYKIHPLYWIRHHAFFLELFDAASEGESSLSPKQKIRKAESIREDLVFMLEGRRMAHLQIEMAIWVLLYNISIICFAAAIMHSLLNTWSTTSKSPWLFGLFIGISLILSIVARMRNTSYNDKILELAKVVSRKW